MSSNQQQVIGICWPYITDFFDLPAQGHYTRRDRIDVGVRS